MTIRNKIPLNLNNGEHRDVVLNEYKLNGDTLSVKAFFCAFQQRSGNIKPPFLGTFVFKITGNRISILKSDIMELGNWSGYIGGWE